MLEILKKIRPSTKERKRLKKSIGSFLKRLNSKLKDAWGILGGSGAKDTWLSGSYDVDIFVQFDYPKFKDKSEQLSAHLERALKLAFPKAKLERLHGSRDYFQLSFEGLDFEVVPSLNVRKPEEALNITDLSHLHSGWINAHTKNLKDDIRLSKQFCKANRVYGAESYIGGFSGYVLEVLVAHYDGFEKFLLAATKWKDKEVIDPARYYPNKDALFHLNSSKQQSPIILIDPTDKHRNAAAALGYPAVQRFKEVASAYLKKPSLTFFEREEINFSKLKEEAARKKLQLVYFEVQTNPGKLDIVGAQMVKAFEFFSRELTPFVIKKSGWEWDKEKKATFYFLVEKGKLLEFEIRAGPPLKLKDHAARFRKEHPHVYEEKSRLFAKIKVEHPLLKDFVSNLLKSEYLKEKVRKIRKI
jgi:tRNA nucleotidyltransferase (CCA-adding enzyme)